MSYRRFLCAHCGKTGLRFTNEVNRADRESRPLYCDKTCHGLSRRLEKSVEQKRAEKAAYDRHLRATRGEELRAKKRAAYYASLEADAERVRETQRAYRAANMHKHVEYCRRPEYREKKRVYDQNLRDTQAYGPFAESAALLRDLETEIASRATRYEIYCQNDVVNKSLKRKREYDQAISG